MTTLPMSDPVDAPGWTIRLEQPIDLDQIHDLHRAAFRGSFEAELVDAIRSSAAFIPELSLVALTDDGSVLGHVLISQVELQPEDVEAARTSVLALAPIAVLPQHQERGIGTALMQEALAMADQRAEPMIAVVGAPNFYGRFGFVSADDHGVRSQFDETGGAFQVRVRPGSEPIAGTLFYPPAFSTT